MLGTDISFLRDQQSLPTTTSNVLPTSTTTTITATPDFQGIQINLPTTRVIEHAMKIIDIMLDNTEMEVIAHPYHIEDTTPLTPADLEQIAQLVEDESKGHIEFIDLFGNTTQAFHPTFVVEVEYVSTALKFEVQYSLCLD
ncbi:883_t:CDS:1 [Paraglomus brasilianum]|uniref:883_t:CDS:1 n=1 Tax=Paraglomus brasilianum TaxID=144538 RepID=A0A9N9C605_9GLOM|nr:883_t:CDS:1 [Paraglomus brasilianum]